MSITARISPFGTNARGETVDCITLANGHMQVDILTRGSALAAIRVPDRTGTLANVVLTRGDFAGWDRGGSFNALVGRYAGRISGGGFSIDGQFHPLTADPETGITIHGGRGGGWGTKLWRAEPFETTDHAGVTLALNSPDGDNGFPGAIDMAATWTLDSANCLRLDWQARSSRATHINVCSHPYFNLAGAGAGTIDAHLLQLFASRYTPLDDRMIPTGAIADVAGTPLDFRLARPIGPALRSDHPQIRLARGLDHNLVIDGTAGELRPAAILRDPASGRRLTISTTEPGIQVYSSNFLDGGVAGGDGSLLRQGDGLALETQHFPDSPNQPGFPSTLLRPGETRRSSSVYAFDGVD
ncbi:aldose epimerase family protein [Sandarakinorhabdus sp. AAP62]|uniref:aldose epimerase family protein n=1 Tax=Sandarakinorhabdus sp. AAP62 TaxID=1248916 RepID=UPI0002EB62B2|nr:aldose epimerase family protein [Sandarakinorhabdus sp. AAP62]